MVKKAVCEKMVFSIDFSMAGKGFSKKGENIAAENSNNFVKLVKMMGFRDCLNR